MMTCKEVAELGSDYLAGELPWFRRMSVRVHLFLCGDCWSFVSGLRALVRAAPILRGSVDRRRYDDLADRLTSGAPDPPPGRGEPERP